MYPNIIIGDFQIPVYALLIIASFSGGIYLCSKTALQYGILPKYILCSSGFIAAGMLLGSKILYSLTRLHTFLSLYSTTYASRTLYENLQYLFGGYVFYGGLIGAIAGVIFFCRKFGFNTLTFLTILTPAIPFAHCFGRIGCFFAGCCYGMEYHGLGAILFPTNSSIPHLDDVERFPVQLVEAFFNIILFFVLYNITSKRKAPIGYTFGIYICSYSLIRFILEFLRGDSIRGVFILSTSQWISLILLPIGIYMIFKSKKSCDRI